MANWREGYEIGYRAALRNVNEWIKKQSGGCQYIDVGAFMDDIGKDSAGGPSMYAVKEKIAAYKKQYQQTYKISKIRRII